MDFTDNKTDSEGELSLADSYIFYCHLSLLSSALGVAFVGVAINIAPLLPLGKHVLDVLFILLPTRSRIDTHSLLLCVFFSEVFENAISYT